MVDTAHHLSKATLTEQVDNLIPVGKMIAKDYVVVTPIIVVSEVCSLRVEVANMLLGVLCAAEVDFFVVDYLTPLEDVQVDHL